MNFIFPSVESCGSGSESLVSKIKKRPNYSVQSKTTSHYENSIHDNNLLNKIGIFDSMDRLASIKEYQ